MPSLLLTLLALLAAATAAPPVVDDAARARTAGILAMEDDDPVGRLLQVLAARDLDDAALFALAGERPDVAEQVISDEYRVAVDYIASLPAFDLGRLRRGDTVIRTRSELRGEERRAAVALARSLGFPKFKEKKVAAVKVGPFEARVVRVEVTYEKSKRKELRRYVDLAWPPSPARDEESLAALTRHFGARPGAMEQRRLPLVDGSFEGEDALGASWTVTDGVRLGADQPLGEVSVDDRVAADGRRSLRFYAEEETRLFPMVEQVVPVPPGARVRARALVRAENLRVEYIQREDDVFLGLAFVDASGLPVGTPSRAVARLATHPWETLEVVAAAPPEAVAVKVTLSCAVSGTAWFDGVTLELVD